MRGTIFMHKFNVDPSIPELWTEYLKIKQGVVIKKLQSCHPFIQAVTIKFES